MDLKKFESLSPFEIKDELIKLAKKTSKTTQLAFLNAGRGNPNWIATAPAIARRPISPPPTRSTPRASAPCCRWPWAS